MHDLFISVAVPCYISMLFYNPVLEVDDWSDERLQSAGIHAELLSRAETLPPPEWTKLSFDCSSLPDDYLVTMTIYVRSSEKRIAAYYAEADASKHDTVSLEFAIEPEWHATSSVYISLWKKHDQKTREVTLGYWLKVERLMKLARATTPDPRPGVILPPIDR